MSTTGPFGCDAWEECVTVDKVVSTSEAVASIEASPELGPQNRKDPE